MEETLFYVLGLSLVVLALVTSFLGLRLENFPPKPVLALGLALFAGLVVATAAFAWLNGEEEQDHRNELIAAGEELSPAEGLAEAHEGTGEAAPGAVAPPPSEDSEAPTEEAPAEEPEAAAVDGAQIFIDAGCGGCHELAAADSTGTTGPNLDASLGGKDEEYIRTSIIDPNAVIAADYPPDVMPQTYEEQLGAEQIDALAQYLAEAVGANGGG